MRDFPLPVGITTSASLPERTAWSGSHWPCRKSRWAKRSVSSFWAASLVIRLDTDPHTGTNYSGIQPVRISGLERHLRVRGERLNLSANAESAAPRYPAEIRAVRVHRSGTRVHRSR